MFTLFYRIACLSAVATALSRRSATASSFSSCSRRMVISMSRTVIFSVYDMMHTLNCTVMGFVEQ